MKLCDICNTAEARALTVAFIENEGRREGTRVCNWTVNICPDCEDALADQISLLTYKEPAE